MSSQLVEAQWVARERNREPCRCEQPPYSILTREIELSDEVLDRIDEISAPGVTINPADNAWVPPSLEAAARRR